MKSRFFLSAVILLLPVVICRAAPGGQAALDKGWTNPPTSARLRAYWWWLNGNVTKAAITRDLEEMKAKGFGGAVILDAGGAEQDGNDRVPHGPAFFSPEWREFYKHALREANRLGLEVSLNIQSGWNLGRPMVKPEDAAKKLAWSEARVTGPTNFDQALPAPRSRDNFYRDLFVVAYRVRPEQAAGMVPKIVRLRFTAELVSRPRCRWTRLPGFAGDGHLCGTQIRRGGFQDD